MTTVSGATVSRSIVSTSGSSSAGSGEGIRGISPRALSRIGGALYLTIIALGAFGEMGVRNRIVVSGDALATAANMNALESLWRVGLAGELFLLICGTTLAAIFYILIRPVSRDGALLAAFFNLVSLAVEAAMALYLAAALFPLTREEYRSAFQPEQLAALSLWSIQSHAYGFGLALVFFGCFCVVMGYLYLPVGIHSQDARRSPAGHRRVLRREHVRSGSLAGSRRPAVSLRPAPPLRRGAVVRPLASAEGRSPCVGRVDGF